MKKYAVIGSNCFTGSHIVDALLEDEENQVIGVSRSPQPHRIFLPYKSKTLENFRFFEIDIVREFDKLRQLLEQEKPDFVINAAALSEVGLSNFQPIEYYTINTVAVVRLVDFLRQCQWLKRYVHISSAEIYGTCEEAIPEEQLFNPSTPYAASKAAGDMHIAAAARQFNFPALVIRSTNVFGAHQQLFKIIPRCVIYIKLGRTIELHGGGRSIKSFVHIRDVVRGMQLALAGEKSDVFHFSVPDERPIFEIVHSVCNRMQVSFDEATCSVGERLGQDQRYWLDCSKSLRELNWTPEVAFDIGVDETVTWIENNWSIIKTLPFDYHHKV